MADDVVDQTFNFVFGLGMVVATTALTIFTINLISQPPAQQAPATTPTNFAVNELQTSPTLPSNV